MENSCAIDTLNYAQLQEVAFKREQVLARRLTRSAGLSPLAALHQVLEQVASPAGVGELVVARIQLQLRQAQRRKARRQSAIDRFLHKQARLVSDPAAWHAWFDGSAVPNPGRMGIGAVLAAPDGSVHTVSRAVGMGDANAAEYLALIAVLEAAFALQVSYLIVHGDSQVVIQDLTGQMPVRTGALTPLRQRASHLLQQLESVELVWIPRVKNQAADTLARHAGAEARSSPIDSPLPCEREKQPGLI